MGGDIAALFPPSPSGSKKIFCGKKGEKKRMEKIAKFNVLRIKKYGKIKSDEKT